MLSLSPWVHRASHLEILEVSLSGEWMECKKNQCNAAFGGINCLLSEAARLIPSKPAWSIGNPPVCACVVLVILGRPRSKSSSLVPKLTAYRLRAGSCCLLRLPSEVKALAPHKPNHQPSGAQPVRGGSRHPESGSCCSFPVSLGAALWGFCCRNSVSVAFAVQPHTVARTLGMFSEALRSKLPCAAHWRGVFPVCVCQPGDSEAAIGQNSVEETGSFISWFLRVTFLTWVLIDKSH